MRSIACIDDLQKLAKRRVPKMFYDYADSGSWSETTYQANETDLAAIKFRQRVALDVSKRFWRRAQQLILACLSLFPQCQFAQLKMSPQIVLSHFGFSFM